MRIMRVYRTVLLSGGARLLLCPLLLLDWCCRKGEPFISAASCT